MIGADRRWSSRLADAIIAGGLVVLALLQHPGNIIRDTKLDLALDPLDFLSTTLHMWDPGGSFGQVPNQAAGFLFPMGPFFALGEILGVAPWVTQRLWLGLLLVVGFAGTLLLAESLGIGRRPERLVGASLYALAPASIALLGYQSGVQTAHALLPLAMVPLVRGSRGGSARRAGAAGALAVIAMGAANAATIVAILPLPALWLLTREPGPRRRRLTAWWAGTLAVGTLWWTVPLILQGRFGVDFARFTEQAAITTSTTSPTEVLRGAGVWTSYLVVAGEPWVPAGWSIATDALVILGTVAVAGLGLFGLARFDLPGRTTWVLSAALGVVAMAAAWSGPFGGPLAAPLGALLDGALVPFRNVHKVSPLLTLPITLGWIHAVGLAVHRLEHRPPQWRPLLAAAAIAPVLLTAIPLLSGSLPLEGSFERIPTHWQEAGAWLEDRADGATTLIVPAASFGEYEWGRPLDEPIESVADTPWAARNLIPLGASASTRLMDGVEDALVQGRPSPTLGPALARAGVRYVVARNDLEADRVTSPDPLVVRRVLAGSPGIELAASFGPVDEAEPDPNHLVANTVADPEMRRLARLDIYEVSGAGDLVSTAPAADRTVFNGGPASLVDLAGPGSGTSPDGVAAGDTGSEDADRRVLTDRAAWRDVNFGRIHDERSYVLGPNDLAPDNGGEVVNRYEPGEPVSLARIEGAHVSASSYATGTARRPEARPDAALDGDPTTAWRVARNRLPYGQWVDVEFDRPVDLRAISVQLPAVRVGRSRIARLDVSTDAGTRSVDTFGSATQQLITTPAGPTDRLRLTITATQGSGVRESAGIAEITIPGVRARRSVVAPELSGPADVVHLSRLTADPYDLTRSDEEVRLDRVAAPGAGEHIVEGTVIARPGPALIADLSERLEGGTTEVSANSTWGGVPEFAPWHAVDGDPATVWLSDPATPTPRLDLTWSGSRTITEIEFGLVDAVGRRPTRLTVSAGGLERNTRVGPDGRASFAPLETDEISLSFPPEEGAPLTSPVGLRDLRLTGHDDLRGGVIDGDAALDETCHTDLGLGVDGATVSLRTEGTVGDLRSFTPIPFTACDSVTVREGEIPVSIAGTQSLGADTVTFRRPAPPPAVVSARRASVDDWGPTDRTVSVTAGSATVLAVNENHSRGWRATLDGSALEPVRVDGWKQGFLVPEGAAGTVHLDFGPDGPYQAALAVGLVGVLVGLGCALAPGRDLSAPAGGRGLDPLAVTALAATTIFLIGGWLVLVVPVLLALPSPRRTLPAVAAVAYGLAGVMVVLRSGPGGAAFDAGPQILSVLAFAAVLLPLMIPADGRRRSPPPVDDGDLVPDSGGDEPSGQDPVAKH